MDKAPYGTIKGCSNSATVSYTTTTIDGDSIYGRQIGGIVGLLGTTTTSADVEQCANTGSVTGTHCTGGIAGAVQEGDGNGSCIENSYNSGTIKAYHDAEQSSADVGGIVGALGYGSSDAMVLECYNVGEVTGTDKTDSKYVNLGGIAGSAAGGNGETFIKNCYNAGSLGTAYRIGGILGGVGSTGNCTLNNNYWLSTCGASYGIGYSSDDTMAIPKTTTELKALADSLGSAYEEDTNNINKGYPILSWQ